MSTPAFPETLEYHADRIKRERTIARNALADKIAHRFYGADLDDNTPIGLEMLAFGRDLSIPLADALLDCPFITIAGTD